MTEKQYGQKLLDIINEIAEKAGKHYDRHVRCEAGKRSQPYLHLCNGMHEARNIIVEKFNNEISEDVRHELAEEYKASHL